MPPAPWPHARQPPTAPLAAARAPGRRLSVSVSASTFKWSNRDNQRDPRAENVPGSFFVDHTCIGGRPGCWHKVGYEQGEGPLARKAWQLMQFIPARYFLGLPIDSENDTAFH